MRTALLILLAISAPALANQIVWKWVDEKGVTHYSDRPIPGAIRIELSTGNRWDSAADTATPAPGTQQPAQQARPLAAYRNVEIWKPSNEEVIINTGGRVPVNVRVEPALQRNHSLNLYLDGQLLQGLPTNATSHELQDVPRGTHSIVATVEDSDGNRIVQTAPVSFTVRQDSIATPAVGPALRPQPPKRRPGANKLPSSQPSYADLNGAPRPVDPATNAPAPPPKPKPKAPKAGS